MTTGEKIKMARRKYRLTQRELAEKCGIATGTVQQYELGKRQPRVNQLVKISEALNISLLCLLGDDELDELKKPHMVNGKAMFIDHDFIEAHRSFAASYRDRMIAAFDLLNETGQEIAAERVEALSQISAYQTPAYQAYLKDLKNKD